MINLEKVAQYDFVVVVDGSTSMETKDVKSGWFGSTSRWNAIGKTASKFAKDLEAIDEDGLGLVVFSGSGAVSYDGIGAREVSEVFDRGCPGGGTPLAEGLTAALKLLEYSHKKKFIMVFTDGAPNNPEAVRKVIINQANSQATDDECTILFIQVGNDKSAREYLRTLDDELINFTKFDIVDAKTAEEAEKFPSTLELVVHAIGD